MVVNEVWASSRMCAWAMLGRDARHLFPASCGRFMRISEVVASSVNVFCCGRQKCRNCYLVLVRTRCHTDTHRVSLSASSVCCCEIRRRELAWAFRPICKRVQAWPTLGESTSRVCCLSGVTTLLGTYSSEVHSQSSICISASNIPLSSPFAVVRYLVRRSNDAQPAKDCARRGQAHS